VALRRPLERGRDIAWVVVEGGGEGNEDGVARVSEAGGESRRLPEVPPQTHEANPPIALPQLFQDIPGTIGRAVVDVDDFIITAKRKERRSQAAVQRREIISLVEDG